MSTPTAILFPGQGSQTPDMRDTVERVKRTLKGVELVNA
jgi:hypothetical protein